MTKAYKIYQMFMENPHLRACLVFNDTNFHGVLLKKDLEQQLAKKSIAWEELFIQVPADHIENVIFCTKPQMKMSIPYLNPSGSIVGSLLYEEFVSEFFPDDYSMKLSFKEIFEYFEHPVLILNKFKTVLYLNTKAKEILSDKVFGMKISDAILGFDICIENDDMCIKRQDEMWQLMISKSITPYSQYYIYQFIQQKI